MSGALLAFYHLRILESLDSPAVITAQCHAQSEKERVETSANEQILKWVNKN